MCYRMFVQYDDLQSLRMVDKVTKSDYTDFEYIISSLNNEMWLLQGVAL